jgi:hypothetical protein
VQEVMTSRARIASRRTRLSVTDQVTRRSGSLPGFSPRRKR